MSTAKNADGPPFGSPQWADQYLRACPAYSGPRTLGRTRALLEHLGRPQDELRVVHIVGTNGKTSTARMVSAILTAHGRRVGAFVSPGVVSLADEILIQDRPVNPQALADAVAQVAKTQDRLCFGERQGQLATWFEVLFTAAVLLFSRAGMDIAVIEAGIGGLDDPTNVLHGEVCVLTSVGLDHTEVLGSTVEKIAEHKLGILCYGCTLVLGSVTPDVQRQAQAAAARLGVKVIAGPTTSKHDRDVSAAFPAANFATATRVAQAMIGPLEQATITRLSDMPVPGRLEIVAQQPQTILDGAHNPQGMRALARAVGPRLDSGQCCAVVSAGRGRDYGDLFAPLFLLCDEVILTQVPQSRQETPHALAAATRHLQGREHRAITQTVVSSPDAAVQLGRERAGSGGTLIITGSLYFVSYIYRHRMQY